MIVDGRNDEAAPGVAPFLAQFERERSTLPGSGVATFDRLREAGLTAFGAKGFPTRKVEAWKYTDLRRLTGTDFVLASADSTDTTLAGDAIGLFPDAQHRIVFVNGRFRSDLSAVGALPAGARLLSLASAIDSGDAAVADWLGSLAAPHSDRPVSSLNAALMRDGAVLILDPETIVPEPIHLLYVSDCTSGPVATCVRNLVVAGPQSRATLVESYSGREADPYFTNVVSEVSAATGARLDHYRLQQEGGAAYHLSTVEARLADNATYDMFTLTLGGSLTRNDGRIVLDGEECDLRYSGAYLVAGSQHVDNSSVIEHVKPNCRSREVFKGVLDGSGRGVFQGKIIVHKNAQKTDGYQLSNGLLLSKYAEVDAKPELEIFADDVKCSHGSTAGEIDHDALFYLRSRGINESEARALLIEAFVNDALDEIEVEAVRERFVSVVQRWLADHGQLSGGK